MSEASNEQANSMQADIVERLFPKMVANHASKLPELESMAYPTILRTVSDEGLPLNDRLQNLAGLAGNTALTDELVHEATILRLCADGRESEVEDPDRQAAFARSDTNQITHANSSKTLDYYLGHGIEVIFSPDDRETAQRFCQLDDRNVPLIEKLKAKRLFSINGFDDSRVMYAVHDLIDHAWLFDSIRSSGLLDRYDDFLQTIDMGGNAFLYSRQAELLASVGFGARRWSVARSQGEELALNEHVLQDALKTADDPRASHAAELLEDMQPENRSQALFIIENMATQFADERRRWGAVKQVDPETGIRKPMNLIEPAHIALMVESLDMLQKHKSYGHVQLAATVEVENMLTAALKDSDASPSKLSIPIPRLIQPNSNPSSGSEEWIRKHLSVSTSYNKLEEE
jgi:hypothetical protein